MRPLWLMWNTWLNHMNEPITRPLSEEEIARFKRLLPQPGSAVLLDTAPTANFIEIQRIV